MWRLARVDTRLSPEVVRQRLRGQLGRVGGQYAVRESGAWSFHLRAVEGSWLFSPVYILRIRASRKATCVSLWRRFSWLKHLFFMLGAAVIAIWLIVFAVGIMLQEVSWAGNEGLLFVLPTVILGFLGTGIFHFWADRGLDGAVRRLLDSVLS